MELALQIVIGAVIGYLFGMIPTGAMVGWRHGVDLTRIGSGSTGATNVLRTFGTRWAIVVFAGDLLKGAAAVLVTAWIVGGAPWSTPTWGQVISSAFAVVGHTFSPLLGFKGGKGVMAGGGGLLIISPVGFLAALICGVMTVVITRFMSLGSIVGATVAGVVVIWQGLNSDMPLPLLFYGTAVPGFVYWTHRSNIHRLLMGTERKVSRSATHR